MAGEKSSLEVYWFPERGTNNHRDAPGDHISQTPSRWPTPVPSDLARIGSPPIEPTPPHMGVIQTLFPVVGGVGLLGFAIAFGNSVFLYIAGVMIVLMLGFSLAMRWSQRRGVRKRAAADARRYAAYLRERDDELAEAGELQRRALDRLYPTPGSSGLRC